jgi:parallel beta-helix repeat protein
MKKNILPIIGISMLIIGLVIAPTTQGILTKESLKLLSNGKIIYVGGTGPGNYSTIQDAIDNSSNDDTVFVYEDSSPYLENITIDKPINLIGEDRNTTIIDGNYTEFVVYISADWVNFSGFMVRNSSKGAFDAGIYINSNYNKIYNNYICSNNKGILIWGKNCITIRCNFITSNHEQGIYNRGGDESIIFDNFISSNYGGISLEHTFNCSIINNSIISNKGSGILLLYSKKSIISNNTIDSNKYSGINLGRGSEHIRILNNIISYNRNGIYGSQNLTNLLVNNNHISNNKNCGIEFIWFIKSYIRIKYNNFRENEIDISINFTRFVLIEKNNFIDYKQEIFIYKAKFCFLRRNFWNESRIKPKVIYSNRGIFGLIPWLYIDFNPAKEPYDI